MFSRTPDLILRKDALDTYLPYWMDSMARIASERGLPKPSEVTYRAETAPAGALFVGTPEQVAEKIMRMHGHMKHDRQIFQLDFSSAPQKLVLESIELLGTEVLTPVNSELSVRA